MDTEGFMELAEERYSIRFFLKYFNNIRSIG